MMHIHWLCSLCRSKKPPLRNHSRLTGPNQRKTLTLSIVLAATTPKFHSKLWIVLITRTATQLKYDLSSILPLNLMATYRKSLICVTANWPALWTAWSGPWNTAMLNWLSRPPMTAMYATYSSLYMGTILILAGRNYPLRRWYFRVTRLVVPWKWEAHGRVIGHARHGQGTCDEKCCVITVSDLCVIIVDQVGWPREHDCLHRGWYW